MRDICEVEANSSSVCLPVCTDKSSSLITLLKIFGKRILRLGIKSHSETMADEDKLRCNDADIPATYSCSFLLVNICVKNVSKDDITTDSGWD